LKQIHVSAAIIYRTVPQSATSPAHREVFTTARGYGDYKGWWEFPGGKIERDETGREIETAEQALVREIREELDSTITVKEKIATVEWDYPKFHLTMECFMCELVEGNLTLLEAEDARWLTKENIQAVKWLPADENILSKIRW